MGELGVICIAGDEWATTGFGKLLWLGSRALELGGQWQATDDKWATTGFGQLLWLGLRALELGGQWQATDLIDAN